MTEQDHNLRIMLVLIVAALAILLAMCGCVTKRITETVEVHDTTTIYRHDTTTLYQSHVTHDTIHLITEREIQYKGDTVYIRETNNHYQVKHIQDSASREHITLDSIRAILNEHTSKEVVKTKRPLAQRLIGVGMILAVFAIAMVLLRRLCK